MDSFSVGAVVQGRPVVGVSIVVRVVGRRFAKWETVRIGGIFRLVIAETVPVAVLPLRGVKRPDISPVNRCIPFENGPLIRGVARTVCVAVEAPVSVPVRSTKVPRAVITVNRIGVVITVPVAIVIGIL